MDYNEFAQRIKNKYPEYKDMDNKELSEKIIAKYPEYKSQVTFENIDSALKENKGIDITPSGLAKKASVAISTPIRQLRYGESKEEARANAQALVDNAFKNNMAVQGLGLATDIAPYFTMPQLNAVKGAGLASKASNLGLTGAYQGGIAGGLESLKQEGDLSGVGTGALVGGGVGAGLPVGAKVATQSLKLLPMSGNLVARSLGRLDPETLARAVNPNSKALDLNKTQAENLLMNTTESVRNNYNNLLKQRGQAISEAEEALRNNTNRIDANNVLDDITSVFNQGQGEKVNTVRDLTGNLEDDLLGLVANSADEAGTIAPIDLQRIKQEVGQMTNWADTTRPKIQNTTLEQIYGKINDRLLNLSPELAEANANYAQLKNFQNNEGLKRILRPGDNIDSASSALKNYNSTVTKGNTNRNIQDLENVLVNEGYEPFLANIDDVNAAMDLNNVRGTGDSWLANLTTNLTRPMLKGVRELNRREIPQKLRLLGQNIGNLNQRLLPPVLVKYSQEN